MIILSAIIGLLKIFLINSAKMIMSKKLILWGLGLYAKTTETKIDDNLLGLVEAGYNSDVDAFKKYAELLVESIKKETGDKK